MSKGLGEFGAGYIVREYDGNGNLLTVPVEVIRRHPDGSERVSHTLHEAVEHPFTTLEEAVDLAVAMTLAGREVGLSRGIDGRSGSNYSQEPMVEPDVLGMLVRAAAGEVDR